MWPRSRSASSSQDKSVWSDYMERPEENEVELVDLVTDDDVEVESDQFKILNYLMGKPLSPSEEAEVLQSLQNTNAACIEDLLQIINEDSGESRSNENETIPKITFADDVEHIPSPTLSVVACMRLKLATLELSPEGLDVCQSVKQGARITSLLFLAEYLPPRSCINNTPVRISSKRICNNVITFEQEKLHSCESNKPLEFTILIKKSGCMESVFGVASFEWTKVLLSNNKCEVSLIVSHPSKNTILGKLKIRIQIGDENTVLKPPQREVSAPRRLEVERRVVVQPDIVPVMQEEKRAKNKSDLPQTQTLLLRSLFSVTCSRDFAEDNLFLVLKAFWLGEDCKSTIFSSKADSINFNVSAPVFLSPYFLSRCKGNNAILEVWSATVEGDQLIGITLLPLHTFYLAYHDNLVTKTLLDCKLPVISVDHWLQVVSTQSGSQVGEVMCLLTFGSEEQIIQLEIKRGLRNCDKEVVPVSCEPKPTSLACSERTTNAHSLSITVLKLKGVFGAKVEAECFVELNIPDINGVLKKMTTACTPCGLEAKLSSIMDYQAVLPVEKCLSKFFSSLRKDCLTFEVFCKISAPILKNIKVAEAHLLLSDLEFLEDQFSISEEPAYLSLALPVKVEGEKMPRLITNDNGTLVVRLIYSKAAKEALLIPEEKQSSVATQTDGSEKEDDQQLWSTTLLSQLQKLRISKTSASSKEKENAPKKTFRCHVKVEKAIQLPYTKTTTEIAITHSEPCTYVSISNVGDAKVSPVVLYSIDPVWNWSCEVELPAHLLLEGSENLVLKVWQLPSCTETPNIKSNTILCFAAVQIADLKYGLPKISGWFNLVNYSGKYCGKIYICITPLENLPELMFPQRGLAKQNPFVLPHAASVPVRPAEPPALCKPNPFIDLSSSIMESTLRKQLLDFDELTTQLKENISDLRQELAPSAPESAKAASESEDKGSGGSEASEEESSTDTVDSDVAKLLAKFDLETLHKIVEQLDDEVNKMNHGSKPDYVCSSKEVQQQSPPQQDSDLLVPPIEADRASVGSHSDSGISNSARKRHLQ